MSVLLNVCIIQAESGTFSGDKGTSKGKKRSRKNNERVKKKLETNLKSRSHRLIEVRLVGNFFFFFFFFFGFLKQGFSV